MHTVSKAFLVSNLLEKKRRLLGRPLTAQVVGARQSSAGLSALAALHFAVMFDMTGRVRGTFRGLGDESLFLLRGKTPKRALISRPRGGEFDPVELPVQACRDGNERKVEGMRKHVVAPIPESAATGHEGWFDLDRATSVEVTSEDKDCPIESALLAEGKRGWRAAKPGTQTIRLVFDEPRRLRRIWLVFEDAEASRTQEFVLRWSRDGGHSFREIVRQQWNFSPSGGTSEVEDYVVDLLDVAVLELIIVPDNSGGEARASLRSLRIA
jgi:hypothetical protein